MFFPSIKWDLSSTLIGIFSAYTLTSFVLFRYPTLLHKKKTVAFLARHISHRGGAGEGYENTMMAFRRAVHEARTDMLEVDCHITRDGKVVVVHDSNLLRLTGVDKDVISLNYDELPILKSQLPIEFQPGEYFTDERVPSEDRKIPLLEEVFKNFAHLPVNIDIKERNIDLIERVSSLISEYKMEEHCVWGNKSAHITEKCYEQVYLWVLNDEADFEEAFRAGATGVMTDYPTKLTKFLQNNDLRLLDEVSTISK